MGEHVTTVLSANSQYVGRICPVTRQTLGPGQTVVVCTDSGTPMLLESWQFLEGHCPFCDTHVSAMPAAPGRVPPAAPPLPPTEVLPARDTVVGARLVVPGGASFALNREVTDVGRHPDNHIVLSDASVSRRHARIRRRGRFYYLSDLGSSNGTWMGEQRIYGLRLEDGDRLRFGTVPVVFKQVDDHVPHSGRSSTGDTQPLVQSW